MPEIERRSPIPPFTPSRPLMRSDQDDPFAALGVESPPQREGLPASYRMRNDHLVDHLTSRLALPLIRAVPIRDIDAPRASETDTLDELVRSIEALGVLQPLFVRAKSGRFELIAGTKRLAAAKTAGLTEVPCLVYTCDEARARAIAEAENLRVKTPTPAEDQTAESALSSVALKELQHGFSTIESCLHLLVDRDASLRDRVALDLIRTEAHRARRLVQCLNTLAEAPTLALAAQPLRVALDQALDAFGPERRLSGVQVRTEAVEGLHSASVDPEWFGVAVSGLLGGLLPLVQNTRTPIVHARLSTASSGNAVVLELSQSVVTLPEWAMLRFFDVEWTDRPGGYQAAVELAAAKRLIELHRGEITLAAGDRSGCRVTATVPAAR